MKATDFRGLARCAKALSLAVWMTLTLHAAHARVVRIVIDEVKPLPADQSGAIATEQIAGRAFGELDPQAATHRIIQDINLVKDADGKVRYVATFVLTKPVDAQSASGLMWHEAPNRARPRPNVLAERSHGDIDLTSAWQGDNAGATAVRERANVDLTTELVDLITEQRNFQANAKAMETSTSLTSTIIQIRN